MVQARRNEERHRSASGWRFLLQLVRVCLGFVAALVVCGLFLAWGLFRPELADNDPTVVAATFGLGLVAASVVGAIVLLPAIPAIALAEVFRIRSVMYHVGVAGLIALGLWLLGDQSDGGSAVRPGTSVAIAAGFLSGLTYWLIAGRTSGNWQGASRG